MRVIVLGIDGYIGWPLAEHLQLHGHEVIGVDNYSKRDTTAKMGVRPLFPVPRAEDRGDIEVQAGDVRDDCFMGTLFAGFRPDAVYHLAEIPSLPYSMLNPQTAKRTLENNLCGTLTLAWTVKDACPDCHIIKIGTLGEYGTPNLDIPEGWIDIKRNGRRDRFLFPRTPGSVYHLSKVADTDLLWFWVRTFGLRVTDLMQGPVYGVRPDTHFWYDDIWGAVMNRFLLQAATGKPLTVYGSGNQRRGFIYLDDSLECLRLSLENPANPGQLIVRNQITEIFSVMDLAHKIHAVVPGVRIEHKDNPRVESEDHYYNVEHKQFIDLGLKPTLLDSELINQILKLLRESTQ